MINYSACLGRKNGGGEEEEERRGGRGYLGLDWSGLNTEVVQSGGSYLLAYGRDRG